MPSEYTIPSISKCFPTELQNRIQLGGIRSHAKACERYVDVLFKYPSASWNGSVPIEYRRTGTLAESSEEIAELIVATYPHLDPAKRKLWAVAELRFWKESGSKEVTFGFFKKLCDFQWHCVNCSLPPNPNWARRMQDIKEMGYTLATNTSRPCRRCNENRTHIILLSIPRGGASGYEAWSPQLRQRILAVLGHYDAYDNRSGKNYALLPDHKFPEIRWDERTRRESLDHLTDEEIRAQFQLMSNQRNQQKREVCRNCFQTGKRGTPFGIDFYYAGGPQWTAEIPTRGSAAEKGCVGCGWYDLKQWRETLNKSFPKA